MPTPTSKIVHHFILKILNSGHIKYLSITTPITITIYLRLSTSNLPIAITVTAKNVNSSKKAYLVNLINYKSIYCQPKEHGSQNTEMLQGNTTLDYILLL